MKYLFTFVCFYVDAGKLSLYGVKHYFKVTFRFSLEGFTNHTSVLSPNNWLTFTIVNNW